MFELFLKKTHRGILEESLGELSGKIYGRIHGGIPESVSELISVGSLEKLLHNFADESLTIFWRQHVRISEGIFG